jgi:hypothetical protein
MSQWTNVVLCMFFGKEPRMTRRSAFLTIVISVVAASATFAQSISPTQETTAQSASKGLTALQQAASTGKYLFVFFWKDTNQQTDAMWGVLQSVMRKAGDRAESVAVNVTDPVERAMVKKFGVDRSPVPLVLAFAPNGAITSGLPLQCDENQLLQAFVSPGTAQCFKALQARKLVLLSVQSRQPQVKQVSLQKGVADFVSDPQYAAATEIVVIDPADSAETAFLQDLRVDPRAAGQITVLLAPPGSVVGTFTGNVTKQELVAKLASAQSSSCPGGKCGPGGCGPKR